MGQAIDNLHIRWMVRRDMPEILEIEDLCFPIAWSEDDFLHALKQRDCIGMVVERDDQIVGFMVYELDHKWIRLLNIAVLPSRHREGIGSQLMQKLFSKLRESRPNIGVDVRESNLYAQLFLRYCDFDCYAIQDDFYDNGESAYRFRYNLFGK